MIIKKSTTKQAVKLIDSFYQILKKNSFQNTVNKIKRQVRLGRNYLKNLNVSETHTKYVKNIFN